MLDWEADCKALEGATDVTECESGLGVDVERWVSAGVAEFICDAVSLDVDDDVALADIVGDSDSSCVEPEEDVGVLDALCKRALAGDTVPLGEKAAL